MTSSLTIKQHCRTVVVAVGTASNSIPIFPAGGRGFPVPTAVASVCREFRTVIA